MAGVIGFTLPLRIVKYPILPLRSYSVGIQKPFLLHSHASATRSKLPARRSGLSATNFCLAIFSDGVLGRESRYSIKRGILKAASRVLQCSKIARGDASSGVTPGRSTI